MTGHRHSNWLRLAFLVPFAAVAPNAAAGADEQQAASAPLELHFYYVPDCPRCAETKAAIAKAEARFGVRIRVVRHDLAANEELFRAYVAALDARRILSTPNLAVLLPTTEILGEDAIIDTLVPTLERLLEMPETPSVISPASAPAQPLERTTFGLVSAAALADGFNPCAFATVILFVSMLSAVGRTRRQIALVGGAFIGGVFLAYLAIGVTFFEAVAALRNIRWLTPVLTYGAVMLVAAAGAFSLVDALRAARGRTGAMLLVLPEGLRDRIRRRLSATAHGGRLLFSAFLAGLMIAALESACTGQVYFPLLLGLIRDEATRGRGLALLLWYNALFVLPLLFVFLAVLYGITSERIACLARRHAWVTKLLLAIVFLAMAVWLVR